MQRARSCRRMRTLRAAILLGAFLVPVLAGWIPQIVMSVVVSGALGPVDALINNAGIVAPSVRVTDFTYDRLRQMFDVNVIGAILVARESVVRMEPRVRVMAIAPGLIETDIHEKGGDPGRAARLAPNVPMQRTGSAEEVARAILWLMSDEASYITGSTLDVTGGR